jgi:hypothetical protein
LPQDEVRARWLFATLAAIDTKAKSANAHRRCLTTPVNPGAMKMTGRSFRSSDTGRPVSEMAAAFQRRRGSIASRLVRLGMGGVRKIRWALKLNHGEYDRKEWMKWA